MAGLGNRSFQGFGLHADLARRLDDLARQISANQSDVATLKSSAIDAPTAATIAQSVAQKIATSTVLNITNATGNTASGTGSGSSGDSVQGASALSTTDLVPYVGSAGALAEDPNLVWDPVNHRLGIGRTPTSNPLEVAGIITSTSGGFEFPDSSVQTSAAIIGFPGVYASDVQIGKTSGYGPNNLRHASAVLQAGQYSVSTYVSVNPSAAAWTCYYPMTYDHTQCGSSDSSSFPALVAFNASAMKTVAYGGDVRSSVGADILFFSDSGLTTQLPSEVDFYDPVNGIGYFWVQIPTLSHTANGTIYMAVGNSSPPSRTTNPWDANYAGVWHMADNAANTTVKDSTTNGNNGANAANTNTKQTTGKIDGALNYNGSSDETDMGQPSSLNITGNFTLEAWINPTVALNGGTGLVTFISKVTNGGTQSGYELIYYQGNLIVGIDSGAYRNWSVSQNFAAGGWHHIVGAWAGSSTTAYAYVDGSLISGSGPGGFALSAAAVDFGLAYWAASPSRYFDGAMDEVRVSSIARSSDWIKAEYNNQSAPGNIGSPGFWTWGTRTIMSGSIMVATTLNWTDERGNAQSYPVNASGVGVPGWAGYCVSLRTDGVHDLTITTSVSGAGTYDCSVAVSRLL